MTITEHLAKHLTDHGLWPEEASAVLSEMVIGDKDGVMTGRWNEDAAGYSPALLTVLRVRVNAQAVKYIDANAPEHWARPMFTGEVPA